MFCYVFFSFVRKLQTYILHPSQSSMDVLFYQNVFSCLYHIQVFKVIHKNKSFFFFPPEPVLCAISQHQLNSLIVHDNKAA